MTAYYNEHDPYTAQWLRNLIAAGHIAPGDVDERSIEDIKPDDLRGYTQCHFFAGIGVWSYALRRAGWPDSRPVWTGSCPCQPFSDAGQGAGFADERHLWPAFFHLIAQRNPVVVFGEQVASRAGLAWLDLVHADMEAAEYAFGAVDLCAAGVGAPHIRQRLYWVADSSSIRQSRGRQHNRCEQQDDGIETPEWGNYRQQIEERGFISRLGHDDHERLEGLRRGHQTESGWQGAFRPATETSEPSGLGHAGHGEHRGRDGLEHSGSEPRSASSEGEGTGAKRFGALADATDASAIGLERPGPTNGRWADADWLLCRDGKWRPVEPGAFPLVDRAPARMGRLRAYGNAIVPQVAEAFIRAYLS
jgi:DNA (cytosine-5)-methyltransferase 1